jgi:hypothetical protein
MFLVGRPERKKLHGRPRRRWEDNSRMDLRKIGWEGVDWIHLAQDRDQLRAVVNTVMNLPCAFFTEHHAMKAYWGSGGLTPHIL